MWTLAQARQRVTARVGEESTVFWSIEDRHNAINDAQRFIAAVTKGVPLTVTGTVEASKPYLEVNGNIVGMHGSAGRVVNGPALTMQAIDVADLTFPAWRTYTGNPRWVILDTGNSRAYVAPAPKQQTEVEVVVAVTPAELTDDNDLLFSGVKSMERYQNALVNFAVAMLLLRERFDGDAERFYQFAVNELRDAGIDPTAIPPMPPVPPAPPPAIPQE